MAGTRALTERQKRFAQQYVQHFELRRAAIEAGYAERSAHAAATKLINNPLVQSYIAQLQAERIERTNISQDAVVYEIARLAFSSLKGIVKIDENGLPQIDMSAITDDTWAALSEANTTTTTVRDPKGNETTRTSVKVKLIDKRGPLELLGKHLGMWRDDDANKAVSDLADALNEIASKGQNTGAPLGYTAQKPAQKEQVH